MSSTSKTAALSLPEVGLFLGAGASYEWGMPLTWPLTYELTGWLTSNRLRELNEEWRKQNQALPSAVLNDMAGILGRTDMHFEGILGYIQMQMWRPEQSGYRQEYHKLFGKLVEIVYHLLYVRHTSVPFLTGGMRYYEGIVGLAEQH